MMITVATGVQVFSDHNFRDICDLLAQRDPDLRSILDTHGYPPFWKRSPSFETLVHIILEQQVSLASAMAAMKKLKEQLVEISPANLVSLTDEELKACYFSRQKITYTRHLARAIINNDLNIDGLSLMDNDEVRSTLTKVKGIGNWTVDVYLMMALQRCDVFPLGDVALMTSMRETKNLPGETSTETITTVASRWKPYQTVAAFILWHAYLSKRKKRAINS